MVSMGTQSRLSDNRLIDDLVKKPYEFEFYQAVRLCESFKKSAVPLGKGSDPTREALHIRSRISYELPGSDLYDLKLSDQQVELTINFMGLGGIQGPLPSPYSDAIYERLRKKDEAPAQFLDIFNHRFASLLYRIQIKYGSIFPNVPQEKNSIAHILLDLCGINMEELKDISPLTQREILNLAPLLWQHPRNAANLEKVISLYFQVPAKVIQFTGQWLSIQKYQQSILGNEGQCRRLGKNAVLGKHFWQNQHHFTIEIGPVQNEDQEDFLPNGKMYEKLSRIVRLYAGPCMTFTVHVVLKEEQIHKAQLDDNKTHLGWTSFIAGAL